MALEFFASLVNPAHDGSYGNAFAVGDVFVAQAFGEKHEGGSQRRGELGERSAERLAELLILQTVGRLDFDSRLGLGVFAPIETLQFAAASAAAIVEGGVGDDPQ